MRQGQQNRRGRGRNNNTGGGSHSSNNNNRKSANPLTRSFESSGPDVKVRGTPAHIAEKYISLARDALSSGDPVLAESYLQHAEHYNRIILTYREQQMSQGGEYQGALPRAQTYNAHDPMDGEEFDDEGDEPGGNVQPNMAQAPVAQGEGQSQSGSQGGSMQQPRSFDGPPRYDNRQPRHDNNRDNNRGEPRQHNNQPRQDRDGNRFDRNDRGDRYDNRGDNRNFNRDGNRPDNRQDRFGSDRNGPDRNGQDRNSGAPRDFRDDRGPPPGFAGEGSAPASGQGSGQGEAHNGNGHRRRDRFQGNFGPGGAPANGNGDRQPPAFAQPPPMPPISSVQAPPPPVQAAPPPPAPEAEQPAFLRRPVRRPRAAAVVDPDAAPRAAPVSDESE
jgi:hypothetical protein